MDEPPAGAGQGSGQGAGQGRGVRFRCAAAAGHPRRPRRPPRRQKAPTLARPRRARASARAPAWAPARVRPRRARALARASAWAPAMARPCRTSTPAWAVREVYPDIEHRECMRHLWANFKKYFRGEVYDKNMWPAARAYKPRKFEYHWNQVVAASPDVVTYMNQHHNHKWSRSMFSNDVKCDYVNNNLSESLNYWVKKIKDLPLVDLLNILRRMTVDLWDKRKRIASKLSGFILPTVIKQLKAKTRGLGQMKVHKGEHTAEVFGFNYDMTPWGHVVDVKAHSCTCGEWDMTGKPCPHALAFIQMFPDIDMATFVHEYYSVVRFMTAYSGSIPHATDKSQWPQVDIGFKLLPPALKKTPGRQRKNRSKAAHQPGAKS
ncbi:hypothetical protein ACP4OV_005052 [Aristida adscensionis]